MESPRFLITNDEVALRGTLTQGDQVSERERGILPAGQSAFLLGSSRISVLKEPLSDRSPVGRHPKAR